MPHTVYITGILNLAWINVRDMPGVVGTNVIYQPTKGTIATVTAIQDDPRGDSASNNTKVYRWFKLRFEDGTVGWARDDLIEIEGDLTHIGYGYQPQRVRAYDVDYVKDEPTQPPKEDPKDPAPPPQDEPKKPEVPLNEQTYCYAVVKNYGGGDVNIRTDSSTQSDIVAGIAPNTVVEVVGTKQGVNNTYTWLKIRQEQLSGYIREDLLAFDPVCVATLPSSTIVPTTPDPTEPTEPTAPKNPNAKPSFKDIIKTHNITTRFTASHNGIDLAATEGSPIYASGDCIVIKAHKCAKCTDAQPTSLLEYDLNDPGVFGDIGWGYGYGNYIIVKHDKSALPASIQTYLTNNNIKGEYVYFLYGHLKSLDVQVDQTFSQGEKIGEVGNTGNSDGAHLHFEVVVHEKSNLTSLYRLNRLNPADLFIE